MINTILSFLGTSKIKLIISAIVFGAVGMAIFLVVMHVSSLKEDLIKANTKLAVLESNNKILQDNTEVLKENMKTFATANHTNWLTIQQLLTERSEAQKIISSLASATANDRHTISNLNKKLDELLKDPKNDGIVSPALRETVRDIQQSRKPR